MPFQNPTFIITIWETHNSINPTMEELWYLGTSPNHKTKCNLKKVLRKARLFRQRSDQTGNGQQLAETAHR